MSLAATVSQPPTGYALNYTLQLYASTDTVNTAVIPFVTLASDTLWRSAVHRQAEEGAGVSRLDQ
jgi:hypothetical protein